MRSPRRARPSTPRSTDFGGLVDISENTGSVEGAPIAPLAKIVERNQVWSRMAAKYGVVNPVPPWKTSLDGFCDALDQSGCSAEVLDPVDRRDEEDALSATVYAALPYP